MDSGSSWWTIITSASIPVAGGAWVVIQWWFARSDKKSERYQSYEERQESALIKERESISAGNAAIIKDLRTDLDNCRRDLEVRDRDRSRGWDRARYWHQKAWDMRNEAAHARQIVESEARMAGREVHPWYGSLELPPFDAENIPLPSPSAPIP